MSWKDKTAVITGATGGLGPHVVSAFLTNGCKVAAIARSKDKLESLQHDFETLPGELYIFSSDATDESSTHDTIRMIVEQCNQIDYLVHVAGGFQGGKTVAETDSKTWDQMMNLNLRSAFITSKAAWPYLTASGNGRIITISAMASVQPTTKKAAYVVSKAGVIALTQALAEEGKPHNIQANSIAPGIIATDANKQAMPDMDQSKWVEPSHIAQTIVHLCSDAGQDITGSVVQMNGRL